jgi:branched-subunit amino acid transport protein AzlD
MMSWIDSRHWKLWWPFWKWRPVEIVQCRDSFRDIIIYSHIKLWWFRTMLNFCISTPFHVWVDYDVPELIPDIEKFLPVSIFKMATTISQKFNIVQFGTSLSTHISNCDGIGQCWVFAILWWPFWKWRLLENFQCRESIHDIIIYPHITTLSDIIKIWYVGRKWCPELIPDIEKFLPVAIFKMATTIPHKFNIARLIVIISDNVEFLRYCGGHFENGDP